ncbi:hypothetical protein NVP1238A_51 [Vibrio phage 1.238.A._10N.261.52.F10]|nr:MazG-like pyrophosphatase [Vibrio phage 1.238.A._10N.261.52.F10]AUR97300.1 hypothetical protein NVP1238A_51 [Vibrio phage 1.238.A._10N.261.52.F10]AUR97394.1 hypothetical protein NVP1238B_52 [Vibrio phage 1.238.B._10N.261.52.F10]
MNNKSENQALPQIIENYVRWDDDRGITSGSTAQAQWVKLFEEVIELYASLHPEKSSDGVKFCVIDLVHELHRKGKIKGIPVNDDPREHLVDAVGDSLKCITSVANLSDVNLSEAAQHAYEIINARQGSLNPETGIWEKE